MILEFNDQFPTPEQSHRLAELKFPQETLFCWHRLEPGAPWKIILSHEWQVLYASQTKYAFLAAPTVAELIEIIVWQHLALPDYFYPTPCGLYTRNQARPVRAVHWYGGLTSPGASIRWRASWTS